MEHERERLLTYIKTGIVRLFSTNVALVSARKCEGAQGIEQIEHLRKRNRAQDNNVTLRSVWSGVRERKVLSRFVVKRNERQVCSTRSEHSIVFNYPPVQLHSQVSQAALSVNRIKSPRKSVVNYRLVLIHGRMAALMLLLCGGK